MSVKSPFSFHDSKKKVGMIIGLIKVCSQMWSVQLLVKVYWKVALETSAQIAHLLK